MKLAPLASASAPKLRQYQHIRRLSLPDILARLKTGLASTPLPENVKSLNFRYYPKNSSTGVKQFLNQNAPEISFNNPNIPFVVERLGPPHISALRRQSLARQEEIKAAEKEGMVVAKEKIGLRPVEPEQEIIAEDGRVLAKGEKVPAKLTIEFFDRPSQTIEFKGCGAPSLLRSLYSAVNLPIPDQLASPNAPAGLLNAPQ